MKIAIVLSFMFTIPIWSYSQSISAIFKLLPLTCTPELSIKERSILLNKKEYIVPGGDSLETVKYSIEVDEKKNYARYEYTFTTGQAGFLIFEIRKFIKADGELLIVFSRYGGTHYMYDQQEIAFFEMLQNKLVQLKEQFIPENIETTAFIKKNCPDSIKTKLVSYVSSAYDLNPEVKNELRFRIFFEVDPGESKEWFIGDEQVFKWTGKLFKVGKIKPLEYFKF